MQHTTVKSVKTVRTRVAETAKWRARQAAVVCSGVTMGDRRRHCHSGSAQRGAPTCRARFFKTVLCFSIFD